MIAYCPLITPTKCGLTGTDHKVEVTSDLTEATAKTISLVNDDKLQAKKGTIKSGKYDACYWELVSKDIPAGQSIFVKVT